LFTSYPRCFIRLSTSSSEIPFCSNCFLPSEISFWDGICASKLVGVVPPMKRNNSMHPTSINFISFQVFSFIFLFHFSLPVGLLIHIQIHTYQLLPASTHSFHRGYMGFSCIPLFSQCPEF